MRTLLALVLLPSLALAAGAPPKKKTGAKPAPKVVATPEPEPELDPEKTAQLEQLLTDAKHELDMAEFINETECLTSAKKQISEAKMYKSMNNTAEASAALELALKYADQPAYPQHQQILDLKAALKRESER